MSVIKEGMNVTKDLISSTVGAPSWVKQIAESVLVIAASLSVLGINFDTYFNARAEVAILEMKAELKYRYKPTDVDSMTVILLDGLKVRIQELENKAH